jgi:hypothetical protein
MKRVIASMVVLVGLSGAGYCQNSASTANDRPVHPGTALLDSMGIVAGAPEPVETADTQAGMTRTSAVASPDSTPDKP